MAFAMGDTIPAEEDTIPAEEDTAEEYTPPAKKVRTSCPESQEKEKEKEEEKEKEKKKEESPKTPEPPPPPNPPPQEEEVEEQEEEVLGPDEEICMNEGCGERKSVHTQVCKRCVQGWSKRLFGWD